MTRKSPREIERAVDDLAGDVPDEPPLPWLPHECREFIPRKYWDDWVEALRWFNNRLDEIEEREHQ